MTKHVWRKGRVCVCVCVCVCERETHTHTHIHTQRQRERGRKIGVVGRDMLRFVFWMDCSNRAEKSRARENKVQETS